MPISIDITENGTTVLATAGKYCADNIAVKVNVDTEAPYNEGKQAQYDAFWDTYQDSGNRTDYANAFYGAGWNDTTYKPKYPIISVSGASVFANSAVTEIGRVEFLENAVLDKTFDSAKKLHTIGELALAESCTFVAPFSNASNLANLTISGTIGQNGFSVSGRNYLTKESLISIINALSAATNGLTVTLEKTAVALGFNENLFHYNTFTDLGFTKQEDGSYYGLSGIVSGKKIFVNDGSADVVALSYHYKNTSSTSQGMRFYFVYKDGTTETHYPINKTEYTRVLRTSNSAKVLDYIVGDYGSGAVGTWLKDFEVKRLNTDTEEWANLVATKPNWTIALA